MFGLNTVGFQETGGPLVVDKGHKAQRMKINANESLLIEKVMYRIVNEVYR